MKIIIAIIISWIAVNSALAATVKLNAKLDTTSQNIQNGMNWRVFSTEKDENGNLKIVGQKNGGNVTFNLNTGTYIIHAGYGEITEIKQINVTKNNIIQEFILNAGGVRLNAVAGEKKIDPNKLSFNIFEKENNEQQERKLIAENVKVDEIIRLKAGIYHVVSEYGNINVSVRADLEVKAGQVTTATLQHRGAKIEMKLVSKKGGAPIANTAWTILTEEGENVFESKLIAPEIVLAEGTYEASVRNGEETYIQELNVKTGQDQKIEVLIGK